MMRAARLCVALLVIGTGCKPFDPNTYVQMYEGPARSLDGVAHVRVSRGYSGAFMHSLDGKTFVTWEDLSDRRRHHKLPLLNVYRVLPGDHEIEVFKRTVVPFTSLMGEMDCIWGPIRIRFTAKAGCEYLVSPETELNLMHPDITGNYLDLPFEKWDDEYMRHRYGSTAVVREMPWLPLEERVARYRAGTPEDLGRVIAQGGVGPGEISAFTLKILLLVVGRPEDREADGLSTEEKYLNACKAHISTWKR